MADFLQIECESNFCESKDRTFSSAFKITIPVIEEEVDKGFNECCYENLVLADDNFPADDYKNDYLGVSHQKQLSSETCTFLLREIPSNTDHDLSLGTYGTFKAFSDIPENLDLQTCIIDWKLVLAGLGEGTYQIVKQISLAGFSYEELSNTYNLKRYSIQRADKTVRIDTTHDGRMLETGTDFKGSGFKTSIRLVGFFGNREAEYIQDNEVFSNDEKIEQVSIMRENKYQFQGNKLPDCITDILFDFMFLGNEIFLNDYNSNNHSYKYKKKPVKLSANSGTKFNAYGRSAQINLTFEDRYKLGRNINY